MRERESPLLIPSSSLWGGESAIVWANTKSRVYLVARNRFVVESDNKLPFGRCIADDISGAYYIGNAVLLNNFLYLSCALTTTEYRGGLYRYDLNNTSAKPVRIDLLGQSFGVNDTGYMTCNGSYFYFTRKAGHENRDGIISKYAIEGKFLRYVGDIICEGVHETLNSLVVRPDETIFMVNWKAEIYQFSSKGELIQHVIPPFNHSRIHKLIVYDGDAYICNGSCDPYLRRIELQCNT